MFTSKVGDDTVEALVKRNSMSAAMPITVTVIITMRGMRFSMTTLVPSAVQLSYPFWARKRTET